MEREDLPILKKWDNDIGIMGEYEPIIQETKTTWNGNLTN